MGFLLVCMGVQFIINGVLKLLKRTTKAHFRLPETCSRQTNVLMRLFFQRHWPFAEYEHSPYQRGTGGYGANIADGRH